MRKVISMVIISLLPESMGPLGVDLKIALINSGYSPIPDNYIAKLATKIFGKKIELLEVNIRKRASKFELAEIYCMFI